MKSKFIVIEGIDGSGKTTACTKIVEILSTRGIRSIITREPGGTPIAEKLRELIKYGVEDEIVNLKAELLMIYAARIQLLETVIKPALSQGIWVIGDRHDISSHAYQGAGRGLKLDFIKNLSNEIIGEFRPDLTIYLDVTPEIGLSRIHKRGKIDIIEKQSVLFFHNVRNHYLDLVSRDISIRKIDANQPLNKVMTLIKLTLLKWLK